MESLSKEKNLIVGLLLGMAIAIAIPYAQSLGHLKKSLTKWKNSPMMW